MSIFGWSYPPGCSGPPEDIEICEMCGEHYDGCVCPVCPVCEEPGDPYCYKHHGLKRTEEQKFLIESNERYRKTNEFCKNEYWKTIADIPIPY
jgi:hypothetical protein